MIVHSVAPLCCLLPESPPECFETLDTPRGLVMGKKSESGFLITRVLSTDPTAYLDNTLTPGGIYRPPTR